MREVKSRYGALRFFSKLFLVLGVLAFVTGAISLIGGYDTAMKAGSVGAILGVFAGLAVGIVLLAISEIISVVIDIETNTRSAAEALDDIANNRLRPTLADPA